MGLAGVRIKTYVVFFLLLLKPFASGTLQSYKDGLDTYYHSFYKDKIARNPRKLLMFDAMLDYDDAGANPKHDPRKKPGIGGGGKQ